MHDIKDGVTVTVKAALIAVLLAFAIVGFTAAAKATNAYANPDLSLDRARAKALNHVYYDECYQQVFCTSYPDLAGGTYHVNNAKVAVHVCRHWRNSGNQSGWVYVRTLTDNSLIVYDESLWVGGC